jgi:CRISPR-associated protein Cmr3
MSTVYFYVRPTDSLFVRGNLAFGDGGEHGASLMPPPPSLFAGAFRSALLGRDAQHLDSFLAQGRCTDERLHACLGTAAEPGAFAVRWISLAAESRTGASGDGPVEAVTPLPADLLMLDTDFARLQPRAAPSSVESSGKLPLRATLIAAKQVKPAGGIHLRALGLRQHLLGQLPEAVHSLRAGQLYRRDPRLGIGLNADARSAEEGLIYTTEGFAFSPDGAGTDTPSPFTSTGFLVGLDGVADLMPDRGVLRLGGDGRSAQYRRVDFQPPRIMAAALGNDQFRLLLQTPALFDQGWLPNGVERQGDGLHLQGDGFRARLACAALERREVVSGWDLFQWAPKPAQAAAPAGSVYWFDQFEGDFDKLAAWVETGMWPENPDTHHRARRAEGYNRALLGAWND